MKKLIEAREAKVAEFDALTVELEGMDEANEEFDGKFKRSAELIAEIKDLNDKVEEAREASEVIKAVKESRNALDVQDDDLGETEAIVEVNEPDMYRDGGEASFIADAYAARTGDYKAQERLGKHQDVEARDVGTGAFTGLVVPQYLVDKFAEKARAGSAFYNAIQKETLPAFGNKIEISRITTGTSAAIQASENSAVSETDMDDTLLTVNVNTIAGQQDVSRQALERGGQPGFSLENVIFGDLVAAYYTELDDQMLNGSGSSGQHLGIASVSGVNETTYTDASPSVAELYPKLADAVQEVNSNRFAPATAIVMHPRRWGMITAGLDSSNRPLVLPAGNNPDNAMGVGEAAKYGNVVGNLLGIPVITDANVVTNAGAGTDEDQIYIVKSDDHILFEDGIFQMKFEETNAGSLTTKLVVYGYSAFASGRQPLGISKISGTGLVTPTF